MGNEQPVRVLEVSERGRTLTLEFGDVAKDPMDLTGASFVDLSEDRDPPDRRIVCALGVRLRDGDGFALVEELPKFGADPIM